ncbi:MAG: hypothetical protein ACTSXQ_01110 [Alphaproteobacteria bacterium]
MNWRKIPMAGDTKQQQDSFKKEGAIAYLEGVAGRIMGDGLRTSGEMDFFEGKAIALGVPEAAISRIRVAITGNTEPTENQLEGEDEALDKLAKAGMAELNNDYLYYQSLQTKSGSRRTGESNASESATIFNFTTIVSAIGNYVAETYNAVKEMLPDFLSEPLNTIEKYATEALNYAAEKYDELEAFFSGEEEVEIDTENAQAIESQVTANKTRSNLFKETASYIDPLNASYTTEADDNIIDPNILANKNTNDGK